MDIHDTVMTWVQNKSLWPKYQCASKPIYKNLIINLNLQVSWIPIRVGTGDVAAVSVGAGGGVCAGIVALVGFGAGDCADVVVVVGVGAGGGVGAGIVDFFGVGDVDRAGVVFLGVGAGAIAWKRSGNSSSFRRNSEMRMIGLFELFNMAWREGYV